MSDISFNPDLSGVVLDAPITDSSGDLLDAWGRVLGDPLFGIAPTTTTEPAPTTTITDTTADLVDSDSPPPDTNTFVPATDARTTINAVLKNYGLESLGEFLYNIYARQEVDINNGDALIYSIRDQQAYKDRFAANAARKNKGLAELSPGSYVGLEDSYRQLLQANGLPAGFFDGVEDFQKFIEADISPRELQDRIQLGFNQVDRADPETLRQFQLLYPDSGIGNATREELAAVMLDPTRSAPLLARRAQAAKIGARAFGTAGLQLGATTAENLASFDYSDSQVQSAFGDYKLQSGLLDEMTGEELLTQDEKIGSVFGSDVEAQKKLARRRDTRKSPFSGGGRFTSTSGVTSGTQESGLGSAQ